MIFSEMIRSARHRAGLTQRQLADSSGISLRTITNYENARSLPRSERYYRKLEKALSLDPGCLDPLPTDLLPLCSQNSSHIRQIQELLIQFSQLMTDPSLNERDKELLMYGLWQVYWQARGIPHPFS